MATIAHHNNLLLDDLDVIALLQLNHLYGGQIIASDNIRLKWSRKRDVDMGCESPVGLQRFGHSSGKTDNVVHLSLQACGGFTITNNSLITLL